MTGILVVIPCLNEEAALPGLLRQQLAEPGDHSIVVADGGSTDSSRAIVAAVARDHPRLTLIDNPARLQAAGVNRAVAELGGDARWLVRIDAHCDYPEGYVRKLIDTAERQHATSVVVPMVSRGETCFQRAAATAQNSRLGTGGSPHRHVGTGAWVDHGHHALMDMTLFRQVGGYRETMSHNEDAELDLRLAAAGGRLWLEPRLALGYLPRRSAAQLWRQYLGYGRGRAQTLLLHRRRPKLRQTLPLAVPAAALVALLTPVHWLFAAPLLGWALLCLAGGIAIGARAGGGCAMLSGVPAMIMHLAWGLGFLARIARRRML
ncbi:glycosyltransferase family 2 protein [Sphingomonas sp.]|uniref:glycosyltransferase family 2 protein n=1 Tax=Sphingomonas sp. TaxID=28214 RepID=UPI003CC653B2